MLKVKNLTPLSQKNMREFWPPLLIFFCNLLSRFCLILTKILFSIEYKYF